MDGIFRTRHSICINLIVHHVSLMYFSKTNWSHYKQNVKNWDNTLVLFYDFELKKNKIKTIFEIMWNGENFSLTPPINLFLKTNVFFKESSYLNAGCMTLKKRNVSSKTFFLFSKTKKVGFSSRILLWLESSQHRC